MIGFPRNEASEIGLVPAREGREKPGATVPGFRTGGGADSRAAEDGACAGREGPRTITKTTKPTRHVAATAAIHLKTRSGLLACRAPAPGGGAEPSTWPTVVPPGSTLVRLASTVPARWSLWANPQTGTTNRPGREHRRSSAGVAYHSAARSAGSFSTALSFPGLALLRVLVNQVPPGGERDTGQDRPFERVEPAQAVASQRPAGLPPGGGGAPGDDQEELQVEQQGSGGEPTAHRKAHRRTALAPQSVP